VFSSNAHASNSKILASPICVQVGEFCMHVNIGLVNWPARLATLRNGVVWIKLVRRRKPAEPSSAIRSGFDTLPIKDSSVSLSHFRVDVADDGAKSRTPNT
jgi:hypothetical protein